MPTKAAEEASGRCRADASRCGLGQLAHLVEVVTAVATARQSVRREYSALCKPGNGAHTDAECVCGLARSEPLRCFWPIHAGRLGHIGLHCQSATRNILARVRLGR